VDQFAAVFDHRSTAAAAIEILSPATVRILTVVLHCVMRLRSHGVRNIRVKSACRWDRCPEPGVARQHDRLRAAFHFELRENAGDVIADGLGAYT
jgi:hypothetical protein